MACPGNPNCGKISTTAKLPKQAVQRPATTNKEVLINGIKYVPKR